ncbi:MAG: sugar ABC transporter permease, partial [Clostridiaceae bacterium]|nr:sugar ABC transporter permease [Clostridiaceae bacterium]
MKKKTVVNYNKYGYYFVAPFIIAFLVFQLYPIVHTMNLSLTDLTGWATEYEYVGLRNFVNLFENKLFFQSLKNTVIIWTVNFIPQLGIGLLLAAWFTDLKMNVKGQGIYKVLFYLPGIITAASISVLFNSLFRFPEGPINNILVSWGLLKAPYEFFRSKTATRLIVSLIQFWMFYGSTMIMLIAAI